MLKGAGYSARAMSGGASLRGTQWAKYTAKSAANYTSGAAKVSAGIGMSGATAIPLMLAVGLGSAVYKRGKESSTYAAYKRLK